MELNKKYLEVLKTFNDYVTIREWAKKFEEMYPDDFKRIDEKARNQNTIKHKTNGHTELKRSIRRNLRENENWICHIKYNKNNSSPIKVKYSQNIGKNSLEQINESASTKKDKRHIHFDEIMDELEDYEKEYLSKDNNLPRRDDYKYIGNKEIKGIEQIDAFEFSSCMMLLMAHRNKDVIDTISKIEYIQDLMREPIIKLRTKTFKLIKHSLTKPSEDIQKEQSALTTLINETLQSTRALLTEMEIKEPTTEDLLNNPYIKPDNEKTIETMTLNYFAKKSSFLQSEYSYILNLPMDSFKKELEFFEDINKVNEFFKNNNISDTNTQKLYKLSAVMEKLQNKLESKFFIYPHKYYKGKNEPCSYNVKSKDFIRGHAGTQMAMKILNNSVIQQSLEDFRKLKPYNREEYTAKDIAHMFFIYDYYKQKKDNGIENIDLIAKEIKYALTIFHGIEIKKTKELMKYNDFINRYDEFEDEEAGFIFTSRIIKDKIKLMRKFIEDEHFRYIIFN